MAVTLIRKRAGTGGGFVRGGGRCRRCSTDYTVEFEPAERLTVEIKGPTCKSCNPHLSRPAAPAPAGREAGRPAQIVKMWWESRPEITPVLRVQRVDTATKAATPIVVPVATAPQRDLVAEVDPGGELPPRARATVDAAIGEDAGAMAREGWRASSCELITAPARAIEQLATLTECDATEGLRITYRLAGAPALVVALTTELLARLATIPDLLPLREIGTALRGLGLVMCTGTKLLNECRTTELVIRAADDVAMRSWLAHMIDTWLPAHLGREAAGLPPFAEVVLAQLEAGYELTEVTEPETADGPPGVQGPPGVAGIRRGLNVAAPGGPFIFGPRGE